MRKSGWVHGLLIGCLSFFLLLGVGYSEEQDSPLQEVIKSAEQGDATAQFNLGLMYILGNGVPSDPIEAYAWALHAAMNGDSELKDMLTKDLTPDQKAAGQVRAKELQKRMK